MNTRQCTRCGQAKPLVDFHSKAGRCIPCRREIDRGRIRHPDDRSASNWGDKARARKRRWAASNADSLKGAARRAVRTAIACGDLVRPEYCSRCSKESVRIDGRSGIQAHHHMGYSNPLNVIWLCAKCHRCEHDAARKGGE